MLKALLGRIGNGERVAACAEVGAVLHHRTVAPVEAVGWHTCVHGHEDAAIGGAKAVGIRRHGTHGQGLGLGESQATGTG